MSDIYASYVFSIIMHNKAFNYMQVIKYFKTKALHYSGPLLVKY